MNYNTNSRKTNLPLQMEKFKESDNKSEYIKLCVIEALKSQQLLKKIQYLTQDQLEKVLEQMGFHPTHPQLQEAYVFSCFEQKYGSMLKQFATKSVHVKENGQPQFHLPQVQQKSQMLETEIESGLEASIKTGFNLNDFIIWLEKNINKIQHNPSKQGEQHRIVRERAVSQKQNTCQKKLQQKLLPLVRLFDQMDILRQENGVEPINMIRRGEDELQADEQEEEEQLRSVKYDPEMSHLNKELSELRYRAEKYLKQFISEASQNRGFMQKLEDGIAKFQKERIQLNDRIGKVGAMRAQQRLKETRDNQKLRVLMDLEKMLEHDNNSVRATHIYHLLSNNTDPFRKRIHKSLNHNHQTRLNYIMNTKLQ